MKIKEITEEDIISDNDNRNIFFQKQDCNYLDFKMIEVNPMRLYCVLSIFKNFNRCHELYAFYNGVPPYGDPLCCGKNCQKCEFKTLESLTEWLMKENIED